MSSITQETTTLNSKPRSLELSRERALELAGISLILLLAAWLRFSNLEALGYVNHYYTAGVKSMLQSWHNFFYVAAEPGGSVSIDKPPVGFWLQAISAYFLGVSGFSVLLPQLVAGILSIAVLYHLVRRSFGGVAGLLAALVLAITPIVVATDRNNTIDSTLILTLLLATWAFIKATETGRLRFLLLGVTLVGIGFNIKMLQAYLPLPALYGLYILGSSEAIRRKIGKLLLATVLLVAISLSWSTAVDLTPADQRPYVGSSSDNSELNLIVGYNGMQRLVGMFGRGRLNPREAALNPQNQWQQPPVGNPPAGGPNGFPPLRPNGNNRARPGGPGGFNIGRPGILRFFVPPLNKEVSWLLPFGLVCAILLAARHRWRRPLTQEHQALILWGGWLLTCLVFFSIAEFFHEYYLSMLGAPLAALVGIGVVELWAFAKEKFVPAASILIVAAAATIAFQIYTATSVIQKVRWLPVTVVLFAIGLIAFMFHGLGQKDRLSFTSGSALIVIAMLITPGVWSVYTVFSANQSRFLPSSYSGGALGPVVERDLRINQSLVDYLQANTQNTKYLMAVPSAMQGANYVLATGRPVLYLGGFNGQDQVVTAQGLAQLVQTGKLRYVYWSAEPKDNRSSANILNWISSSCTPVPRFDATQTVGAPDGARPDPNNHVPGTGGPQQTMQVTLYDCASSN